MGSYILKLFSFTLVLSGIDSLSLEPGNGKPTGTCVASLYCQWDVTFLNPLRRLTHILTNLMQVSNVSLHFALIYNNLTVLIALAALLSMQVTVTVLAMLIPRKWYWWW